jgi:hypothetical protein
MNLKRRRRAMALKPKFSVSNEQMKAEAKAFNKLVEEFELAVRSNLIKKWKNTSELDNWDQVANLPNLMNKFSVLCAKETKSNQDLLNMAGLILLILNFQDSPEPNPQP